MGRQPVSVTLSTGFRTPLVSLLGTSRMVAVRSSVADGRSLSLSPPSVTA